MHDARAAGLEVCLDGGVVATLWTIELHGFPVDKLHNDGCSAQVAWGIPGAVGQEPVARSEGQVKACGAHNADPVDEHLGGGLADLQHDRHPYVGGSDLPPRAGIREHVTADIYGNLRDV